MTSAHFGLARGASGLVCHGPIALLSTLPDAEGFVATLEAGAMPSTPKWIYSGYQMTVISHQEEEQAKPLLGGVEMKFYPQTALQRAGVRFSSNTTPRGGGPRADYRAEPGFGVGGGAAVGRAVEISRFVLNAYAGGEFRANCARSPPVGEAPYRGRVQGRRRQATRVVACADALAGRYTDRLRPMESRPCSLEKSRWLLAPPAVSVLALLLRSRGKALTSC